MSYQNAQTISSNVGYVERLQEPEYIPPLININAPSKPSKPIPIDSS